MKKIPLDIITQMFYPWTLDTALSLQPFIKNLQNPPEEENPLKTRFNNQVLTQYKGKACLEADVSLEDIYNCDELLELVEFHMASSVPISPEGAWGLCLPLQPSVFYGSEALYTLLLNKDGKTVNSNFFNHPSDIYYKEHLQGFYAFLLKKLYNFDFPLKNKPCYACHNIQTGLTRYYHLVFDNRFVAVKPKGKLPKLDLKKLYLQLYEDKGYEYLLQELPPWQFQFRGLSILIINDVTEEYALDIIKGITVHSGSDEIADYHTVVQSLKNLVQQHQIEFELFPFLRINNKIVYGYEKGVPSLLNSVWGEKRLSPDHFHQEAQGYFSNPIFFFSQNINEESMAADSFLELFKPYQVCSLALKPVFYNGKPVGVLGMYTQGTDTFDERTLQIVEKAIPALAQLLQQYVDQFNLEIEAIIKDKFTSIQASVQWKFNEVAWRYLYNKKKNRSPNEIEPVFFNEVYPLYGAIDIRNSTLERSISIQADLQSHLEILSKTLHDLKTYHHSPLLDELIFECGKWRDVLLASALTTADETHLNHFLHSETEQFFLYVKQTEPSSTAIIDQYLKTVHENQGIVFRNQQDFEFSMQRIIQTINQYLEGEIQEIQQQYPCYFEKFKTDGMEYDIYLGQSIAPEQPFNQFHIKNLRLWQLKSMAAIARNTAALLDELPRILHTTQLIFAYNTNITIRFRNDERRFDVEGGYNIRYHMIKKRIDKVHIKDSEERLTQPGKIALVYFNRTDIEDYLESITYLHTINLLEDNLEELELESLQGVDGLKAIRIGVRFP